MTTLLLSVCTGCSVLASAATMPDMTILQAAEARAKRQAVMVSGAQRLGGRADTVKRLTPAQVQFELPWLGALQVVASFLPPHVMQHRVAAGKLTIVRCFAQAAAQAAERRARDDATCPSGPLGTQHVGYNDASAEVVVLDDSPAASRQPSASRPEVSGRGFMCRRWVRWLFRV